MNFDNENINSDGFDEARRIIADAQRFRPLGMCCPPNNNGGSTGPTGAAGPTGPTVPQRFAHNESDREISIYSTQLSIIHLYSFLGLILVFLFCIKKANHILICFFNCNLFT